MGSLKAIILDFYEKEGVYWIRITLVGSKGEESIETECDSHRIRVNLGGECDKSELN